MSNTKLAVLINQILQRVILCFIDSATTAVKIMKKSQTTIIAFVRTKTTIFMKKIKKKKENALSRQRNQTMRKLNIISVIRLCLY